MQNESETYSLPAESLPTLKLAEHLADVCEFAAFLESRGIGIKNTRIERYNEYLKRVINEGLTDGALVFKNAVDSRFKSDGDWRLYVLREVHELMWILRGLKAHIPQGLDEKLETIVSGSDFAALDNNSHGRNVQFELRIASYFCQAGCEVDLRTNTDVIATTNEHAFFVECKRVASMTQLTRRLADAKRQLEKKVPRKYNGRSAYGCIAADVTKIAFSHNGLTFGTTNEHSRTVVQGKLVSIADEIAKFPLFTNRCDIVQYWLQIHIPALIQHPPMTITRFSSYFILNPLLNNGKNSVVKQMCTIDEVAETRNERELPLKKLRRRQSLTLPKGSELWFKPEPLNEIIEKDCVSGKEMEEVVASLKFDGSQHEFTLYELKMVVAQLPKPLPDYMRKDRFHAGTALILEMYIQRYPYEND